MYSTSLVLARQLGGDAQNPEEAHQAHRALLPGSRAGHPTAVLCASAAPGARRAHAPVLPPAPARAGARGDAAADHPERRGLRVPDLHEPGFQADPAAVWASILRKVSGEDAEEGEGDVSDVSGAVGFGG
jgi:hypothetical protein